MEERVAGLVLAAPDIAIGRRPLHAYFWPAGLLLAELLVDELDVRGKRLLEVGCGLGAAGLAAARAGAEVTLSDMVPEALTWAESNAARNGLTVSTLLLDWFRVPEALIGAFDVVVGADVMYGRDLIVPLFGAIALLLAPDGCAYLAEPGRNELALLEESAAPSSLTVERIATRTAPGKVPMSDASETRPIDVYCARLNRGRAIPSTTSTSRVTVFPLQAKTT